jgi:hypothetical protein
LSNGSVTPSNANALCDANPVASAAMPARFIHSRLSSIVLPPKLFLSSRSSPDSCPHVSHRTSQSQFMLSQWHFTVALQQLQQKAPAALGDRGF